jgi:FkbM family methyltransferase
MLKGGQIQFEKEQEDLFKQCLQKITHKKPVMIELGCGPCEYSKLFYNFFKGNCINIGVDVSEERLNLGKKNLPNCIFYYGFLGEPREEKFKNFSKKCNQIKLKDILNENTIKNISILHMDIQGSEVEVLENILRTKIFNKIQFLFVSLHNNYQKCKKLIEDFNINTKYIFEHPTKGGWGDGLIVCEFEHLKS